MVTIYTKRDKTTPKENFKTAIHRCSFCKKEVLVTIDVIGQYDRNIHLTLHGKPLHALVCFIDEGLKIKNAGYIESIEVKKNSETYQELTRLWSKKHEI